ncbi:MAG TPA: 4Fe-4S dicluster domain-containing protein [bacterium]|nr:4Fe-4S dicluster domain-containing protein [bacterium]
MKSVYKKLAEYLDSIPNGFPATESGVELKILEKLFSEEEAALACHLRLKAEPAADIAQRAGMEEREASRLLKGMVKKGLIDLERGKGGFHYKLLPFIVGFYERQNAGIDEEFARYMEQYFDEALYRIMTVKPSVHRVIPIEETIPVHIDIMPYERASYYIGNAKSWGVLKCICRVQKALVGQACRHTVENCLVFSSRPDQFDRTDRIRAIDQTEAMRILQQAEEEGLVHSTTNIQEGVGYICNCCSCACGVLRGLTQYGSLDAMDRSDYIVDLNPDLCTGCGVCADRCPFHALSLENDICSVDFIRCYGCGLCISTCPSGALSLRMRPKSEIEPPPVNEEAWFEKRAEGRKNGSRESSFVNRKQREG